MSETSNRAATRMQKLQPISAVATAEEGPRAPPLSPSFAPSGPRADTTSRNVAEGETPVIAGVADTNISIGTTTVGSTSQESNNPHRHHRHRGGGLMPLAMQAVAEALEWVEPSLKAGYVRAQRECPEPVRELECCPCYFVVACQFNPWEAATNLCMYWNERIELFGDRAFQALTIGSEAVPPTGLTEDDLRLFHTGYVGVLPSDRTGRSVICHDEGRLNDSMKELTASRLRVMWYALQAAYTSAPDPGMSHPRAVVLVVGHRIAGSQRRPDVDPTSRLLPAQWRFAVACRRVIAVLPIVVESFHLLSLSSRTGTGAVLRDLWSTSLEMAGGNFSKLVRMHHGAPRRGRTKDSPAQADAEAREDLMQQLEALGFSRRGIPVWAGGTHSLEDFRLWVRQRRRRERRELWTDVQRAEHKRSMNRVHSTTKRQRRHRELQDLQGQVDQLIAANQRARMAGQALEKLTSDAIGLIHEARQEEIGLDASSSTAESACLPALPVEEYPPDVLAPLEPDPIAPHCLPVLAAAAAVAAATDTPTAATPIPFEGVVLSPAVRLSHPSTLPWTQPPVRMDDPGNDQVEYDFDGARKFKQRARAQSPLS